MKNKVCRILVGLGCLMVASLSAAPLEWKFPLTRSCHEGLAFSDGTTGVLVWGGGDTIRFTVGRGDLWDHRGGYPWLPSQSYTNIVDAIQKGEKDRLLGLFKKVTPKGEPRNPYLLPLGRLEVKIPGATLTRGTLDPMTGLGELFLSDGRAIQLAMCDRWGGGLFAVHFPPNTPYTLAVKHCMEFPYLRNHLSSLGFKPAEKWDGASFTWELPNDDPVMFRVVVASTEDLTFRTERSRTRTWMWGGAAPIYENVRPLSEAKWQAFWRKGARIQVPDPKLQAVFDYGMYRFGAMTNPLGVPAGLQGPWLEDHALVPWNGDYHFNINVQMCYSPAFRGGHTEHLLPLFKMVKSWWPRLRENARLFCGVEDGFVLPHSVDDRGVCIGGFWTGTIDHGSTAWVADMMFRYVKYSGDREFLKTDAYPFMKGAMKVYRTMMEDRDGALSLPTGPSPEWGGASFEMAVGRNPSFQLAAAHRLARNLIAAAKLLGETPDSMWLDVEKRLPLAAIDDAAGGIELFEKRPFNESHRHHSHLAGLYPFDIFDPADPATARTLALSYANWKKLGVSAWCGWCVPWAAVLHLHMGEAEASVETLRAWEHYFMNEGRGSRCWPYHRGYSTLALGRFDAAGKPVEGQEIMQMDGQCAAVAALMELMVHEVNGKPEFFRGCPASWKDVSFENIRLSDGRRASGRRVNGKADVKIIEPKN